MLPDSSFQVRSVMTTPSGHYADRSGRLYSFAWRNRNGCCFSFQTNTSHAQRLFEDQLIKQVESGLLLKAGMKSAVFLKPYLNGNSFPRGGGGGGGSSGVCVWVGGGGRGVSIPLGILVTSEFVTPVVNSRTASARVWKDHAVLYLL